MKNPYFCPPKIEMNESVLGKKYSSLAQLVRASDC